MTELSNFFYKIIFIKLNDKLKKTKINQRDLESLVN